MSNLRVVTPLNPARRNRVMTPKTTPFKLSEFGSHLKERRKVFLRIKPLAKNQNKDDVPFVSLDDTTLVPVSQDGQGGRKVCHKFKFTKIFGPKCNQEDVFKEACFTPISNFLHGGNCFVFAYGATNAGKTFTIQGSQEKPGIVPRAINLLFNSIKDKVSQEIKFKPDKLNNVLWLNKEDIDRENQLKQSILSYHWDKPISKGSRSVSTLSLHSDGSQLSNTSCVSDLSVVCPVFQDMKENLDDATIELDSDPNTVYSVWVSYAEIYNENIYDLLQVAPTKCSKPLSLGENELKEVFIKGLTEVCVCSGEEAFKVFLFGKHNLHQAATNVNHVSSRSHSIFSIKLVKHLNVDSPTFVLLSTCSFVDLAGAERAKKTLNAGERMKESQCINTSLHILGKCLETLRHNQKSKENCNRLLPCRESKLTRLFQRALEGKEILTMIVNINQDKKLFDETMTVLRFSAVAMELQYDKHDHNSTVCSLRKSHFSQFMETFSASFQQSSMESINECPEDARYMKLLAYVEELKQKLEEERKKNVAIEVNVRKEAYAHCKAMMKNMEENFKKRLREERETCAEYEEIKSEMYEKYIERHCKKRQRCNSDSDSESDSDNENGVQNEDENEEDSLENVKFLQSKVEALTALLESSEKIKTEYAALNIKHSKLKFELSTVQRELENALKLTEAINSGPDSTENLMKELQNQLSEHQLMLKTKNEDLEEMKKVLDEAKLEFDAHFHEHEDFALRNSELEKNIAEKDEKISDLQEKLNICNKKLTQQLEIVNSIESEESDMKNKLQSVCEARDEFKFKYLQLESEVKILRKENKELKCFPKESLSSDIRALEALVASHEDQIQQYVEKLKFQEKVNRELQEEMSATKSSLVCVCQDAHGKEVNMLQKEIKEGMKSRKKLLDEMDSNKKEINQQKETIKAMETALLLEQTNTKEMRKVCEAEKESLTADLLKLQEDLHMLQVTNESLIKDKTELELRIEELEEDKKIRDEQVGPSKAKGNVPLGSENLKDKGYLSNRNKREVVQTKQAATDEEVGSCKDEGNVPLEHENIKYKGYPGNGNEREVQQTKQAATIKSKGGRKTKDKKSSAAPVDEIENIPELYIKPDPDNCRSLRPRRKNVSYANVNTKEEIDIGGMRPRSTRKRPL